VYHFIESLQTSAGICRQNISDLGLAILESIWLI
jgi:hypothetical protein